MTEAKWLSWPDPYGLLEQCLVCELTERKLRLFACACCRRLWHRLEDNRLRAAIEVAEKFADSQATPEDLANARSKAAEFLNSYIMTYWPDSILVTDDTDFDNLNAEQRDALQMASQRYCWDAEEDRRRWAVRHAAEAIVAASSRDGDGGRPYLHHVEAVILEISEAQAECVGREAERHQQADLLRDIFGNPFHPVIINPAWLSPVAASLAQGIYEGRSFDGIPILGDALEEAGCDNADILDHCRSRAGHVRGCWVVDALLGKS